MDYRTMRRLEKTINSQIGCWVVGERRYGPGDWAIEAHDRIDGGTFVISSPEDWAERIRVSKLYGEAT